LERPLGVATVAMHSGALAASPLPPEHKTQIVGGHRNTLDEF
jgi:hypothetical protein